MNALRALGIIGLVMACSVLPAPAQPKAKTLQGKVVKVQGTDNLLILGTEDGRTVRVTVDPRVPIRWHGRVIKLAELNEGMNVTLFYDLANDRHVAQALTIGTVMEAGPPITVKGTVLRVLADPNLLIMRAADGKELALGMDQETKIQVGTREVRLVNLTPGMEIVAVYQLRPMATAISTPVSTGAALDPVRGRIVKIVGPDNLVILRTAEGKEYRFLVDETSQIRVNDSVVKVPALREDMDVAVVYSVRDNQNYITTLNATGAVVVPQAAVSGRIRGQVMEGDRPQPELEVSLLDANAKVVAVARTAADGTFTFDNVPPATYIVSSVKPTSMTRGQARVTAQAGQVSTVVINLLR
jgi:hypothetical protein